MRLGLVTDIHNHAAELALALAALRRAGVDRIVTLGDTCDAFGRAEGAAPVADLLHACGAVGVWGNHDAVLCRDVSAAVRHRFAPAVLAFMAGMEPWLEIADCRFSHEEPGVDPFDVAQMWAIEDGPLDLLARARRGFAAAPQRCLFIGHYHRWFAATPDGQLEWAGAAALRLAPPGRYFVVVAPVFDRRCAVYDTDDAVLTPVQF